MDRFGRTRVLVRSLVCFRWTQAGIGLVTVFLLALLLLAAPSPAMAQSSPDTACKLCHVDNDEELTFPSGEAIKLGIDVETLESSVHGLHADESVYCSDCHADRQGYRYPHVPNPADDLSEFRAEISENCERCHTTLESHNPGHLLATDNPDIPVCADCHGGHDVGTVAAMAADPIGTCQSCHATYDDPRVQSAHEEIVANLGTDQDCETCHGGELQSVDSQCQTCHGLLTSQLVLASGETVDLHVDPQTILGSVHGDRAIDGVEYEALKCTDCHLQQEFTGFPHLRIDSETRRDFTVDMESVCQDCHVEIYAAQRDGVHEHAIEDGNLAAATCFDCHGNHDIQDPDDPRYRISETCGTCHDSIYEEYASSVHGAALIGENGEDVPVCTDCHGVHSIESPLTARFRVQSPTLCGGCHADEEIMARHDISTDVFDTYVADFHGTTVSLFEKQSPDHETNKAVCYDCHGVHNILAVTDDNSRVIKENLLETCRECHPGASANFPDTWTSHYKPSLQNNVVVFLIDQFYAIAIPVFIGGFVMFIGTDVFRRVRNRRGRKRQ